MHQPLITLIKKRLFWIALLFLVWLFCSGQARSGALAERLGNFPNWTDKPLVQTAVRDLVYPTWMSGVWSMTTTLVDMAAPLAPDMMTPGFEGDRQFLNQPVACLVRFVPAQPLVPSNRLVPTAVRQSSQIVSDRAFNGLNLARAYLGEAGVKAVKVDPNNPNRQITFLQSDRQLVSTVTGRATETPDEEEFVTTEDFQQLFRGRRPTLYLNEVETTTRYRRLDSSSLSFDADQTTAIYLSPQDPDYFRALNKPAALYRYHLEFSPVDSAAQ